MKNFKQFLREFSFADLHPRAGEWKEIPPERLKQAQHQAPVNIDTELFDLLDASYSYIGGHIDFSKPSDLPANHTIWYAVDTDGDKHPNAVVFGKQTPYGTKWTGAATDKSQSAKAAYLSMFVRELFTPGNFCEVSDALAHILLTRYSVPYVDSQKQVEKIIGKPVKWIGDHPEHKYSAYHGFYERSLGGAPHMKILIGRPA